MFAALCRCGVEVRIDLNPDSIFHQKFCLIDYRLTRDGDPRRGANPGLLCGSANFTSTDCHTNLNHVLVFEDSAVQGEFADRVRRGVGGRVRPRSDRQAAEDRRRRRRPVKVLFAPDHGPEAEVVKQMLKCPKGSRIDCAMFTFAGSSAIDER